MRKILVLTGVVFVILLSSSCKRCSGDFPNRHSGLCWSNSSPNHMVYKKATAYCKNLGGRLPTISELRTLIQNCPATETGGSCGLTDSCLSSSCWLSGVSDDDWRNSPCRGCPSYSSGKYSVFGDAGWFWSSLVPSGYAEGAWGVNFGYARVGNFSRNDRNDVRCVR